VGPGGEPWWRGTGALCVPSCIQSPPLELDCGSSPCCFSPSSSCCPPLPPQTLIMRRGPRSYLVPSPSAAKTQSMQPPVSPS
jgi:hypothetical protein